MRNHQNELIEKEENDLEGIREIIRDAFKDEAFLEEMQTQAKHKAIERLIPRKRSIEFDEPTRDKSTREHTRRHDRRRHYHED